MVLVVEVPGCQAYLQAMVVVAVVDPDQWVRQEVDLAESQSVELPSPEAPWAELRLGSEHRA